MFLRFLFKRSAQSAGPSHEFQFAAQGTSEHESIDQSINQSSKQASKQASNQAIKQAIKEAITNGWADGGVHGGPLVTRYQALGNWYVGGTSLPPFKRLHKPHVATFLDVKLALDCFADELDVGLLLALIFAFAADRLAMAFRKSRRARGRARGTAPLVMAPRGPRWTTADFPRNGWRRPTAQP